MTDLESLDALAADVAAGAGADRALDAMFSALVCPQHATTCTLPAFTDTAGAGPGALFAAARQLWPECAMWMEANADETGTVGFGVAPTRWDAWLYGSHPDLCRAMMGAMIAAKRAEIAGGDTT